MLLSQMCEGIDKAASFFKAIFQLTKLQKQGAGKFYPANVHDKTTQLNQLDLMTEPCELEK